MSRELKFRCWNKRGKCWITFGGVNYWYEDGILDIVNSDNLIYEQFTGLLDRNGKEIYEGDIVEGNMGVFKVKWYDLVAQFMFAPNIDMKWHPPFVYDQVNEMEVIGNIHENKELLGGEE